MVWNRDHECMPVEELQKFQLEKLKETINWVSEKVPFYQNKLKEMGISADDLKSIEDSAKLPLTVKNDHLYYIQSSLIMKINPFWAKHS